MAENTEPPRSVEDVKALLETTEKGGFRNSIRNCLTVFQCDPLLSGAVAYNLLTDRTDILKPIGYKRTPDSHEPVRHWLELLLQPPDVCRIRQTKRMGTGTKGKS